MSAAEGLALTVLSDLGELTIGDGVAGTGLEGIMHKLINLVALHNQMVVYHHENIGPKRLTIEVIGSAGGGVASAPFSGLRYATLSFHLANTSPETVTCATSLVLTGMAHEIWKPARLVRNGLTQDIPPGESGWAADIEIATDTAVSLHFDIRAEDPGAASTGQATLTVSWPDGERMVAGTKGLEVSW